MCGVGICALLFVTREALFVADEGQQQCEYEYHEIALDRIYKILQDEHVNLENILSILSTLNFGCSIHKLLHARNHNKFERAIRLCGLLNLRQTLLTPIFRRRHAKLQIR